MAIPPIVGQGIGSLVQPPEQLDANTSWATNRPQTGSIIRQELLASQGNDETINRLESFTPRDRGSREKPLVMRYPLDIGSGQVPHAMQFKIFWRWESEEFRNSATKLKAESESTLNELVDATNLINDGNFTVQDLSLQAGLVPQTSFNNAANMLMNPVFANPVNPSNDTVLADMLSDPSRRDEAQRQMERNVKSATNRVESIGMDFGNSKESKLGATNISLDKDFLSNRFNKQLSSGGLGQLNSLASQIGLQQRDPQYDQMVSIYLPVCTRINGEDAFTYSDADMAKATGAAAAFNSIFNAATSATGVGDLAGKLGETAKQGALALATSAASGTALAGVVPAISGLVLNPRLEKMFSQKEMRTFSFTWDFYPRNQDEVNHVRDIIETFRYHAHPSASARSTDGSFDPQIMLRVPAEFTIKFLSSLGTGQGNGFIENEYIPKISRCVLTSIAVDYTPNGVFSTFEDNSPTAYSLTLSFSEVAQLTREDIKDGY